MPLTQQEIDDLLADLKATAPEHRGFACMFLTGEQAEAIDARFDELFADDTEEDLERAADVLATNPMARLLVGKEIAE